MNQLREAGQRANEVSKNIKISKAMTTTLIGTIAVLEENMGFLWGMGKDVSKLSDNEKAWLKAWEKIRKEILDKGNNNIRKLQKDLGV